MANALMQGSYYGDDFSSCVSEKLRPKDELLKTCQSLADKTAVLLVTDNIDQGVKRI